MSQDVKHIPGFWINDWETMNFVFNQGFDSIKQGGLWIYRHKLFYIVFFQNICIKENKENATVRKQFYMSLFSSL